MNDSETSNDEKSSYKCNVYKFLNRSISQISQSDNYIANGETIGIMGIP